MAKYIIGDIFEGDYPITQYYNENPQIYTMFQVPGHEGVDWGTPNGTPIIAPFDGIILRDTFADKAYGNFTVVWDPKQKCALWYCHLQDITTQPGDRVTKGQLLGHTNNTGNSSGPHLHIDFVETDEFGNRLNKDNGKQGFLDIMDPNLVEWRLGNQPDPQPAEQPAQETVATPTPDPILTQKVDSQPVVQPSTPTIEVPITHSGMETPPVEAKPIPEHGPTKPSMDIASTIVWLFMNIKSVLLKLWKKISQN